MRGEPDLAWSSADQQDACRELPAAYAFVCPDERGAVAVQQPRVIFIEVTNRCNLRCETCPRTFVTYERPKTLSWEGFGRIVDQFPDMQRGVLHGIGEPLLNPHLPRMIKYLKARAVTVLFNSNATLLNAAWGRALVASELDEMRCSLDGTSPDSYARVRGTPVFHKVVDNLQRFTQLQHELNAEKPRLSLWMIGLRENIAELPDLVRLAAQIGVPEVYLQRMVYYLDSKALPGLMESGHGLFDDFDAQAERIIATAEVVADELGVTLRASGATDPRGSLGASRKRDLRPWSACLRPWTTAYVTANGNCLPCCFSPFATTDYEGLKMGNLFERDFAGIWNGKRYRAWRTELLSDRPPKPCRGCGVHWSL